MQLTEHDRVWLTNIEEAARFIRYAEPDRAIVRHECGATSNLPREFVTPLREAVCVE